MVIIFLAVLYFNDFDFKETKYLIIKVTLS